MKTLRMIGMALVAVVMCAGFAACSDDEEGDNPSSALAGTTWTVVSADESYMEGSVYTFHADGTVSSDPSQGGMRYKAGFADGKCLQVCMKCGKVKEIKSQELIEVLDNLHLKRFRKDSFSLYIYGTCSTCQAMLTRQKRKENTNKKNKHLNEYGKRQS